MYGKIDFKRLIGLWAVLALAVAQIAVAQHSTIHPYHAFEVSVDQHDGHDHQHEQDEEHSDISHICPEFLLAKSIETAFYSDSAVVPVQIEAHGLFVAVESSIVSKASSKAYNPRAPPVLLI